MGEGACVTVRDVVFTEPPAWFPESLGFKCSVVSTLICSTCISAVLVCYNYMHDELLSHELSIL